MSCRDANDVPKSPVRRPPTHSKYCTANGRSVKASYDVKVGDVLELRFGERTVRVEVLAVSEHAGKADAPAMYKELL